MALPAIILMCVWGGGTIILVSQKIDSSMGKLRRGLVTDIG